MAVHNVKVSKKKHESNASLMRRFTRIIRRSGFLLRARGVQYKRRSKSDATKKKEALRRIDWQKNKDKLRRLGKIE